MTADDLARAVGAHALPGFLAGLAALLAATGLVWAAAARFRLPDRRDPRSPAAFSSLRLAIGFVVVAAVVFMALAEGIGRGRALGRLDPVFSDAVAAATPAAALAAFELATHFGDRATQWGLGIAVAALLLWRGQRALAVAWVGAVAGNGTLNTVLKHVFERARPLQEAARVEAGYSFPSGHSSGSVVVYGMLAYLAIRLLPRRWHLAAVLAAAAVAYTTGCSRVFLHVHFATDVAAGFVSGSAWLGVCIVGAELLQRRPVSAS